MVDRVERISRTVAVACLLASAAFFAWWGAALACRFGAALPFFCTASLVWLIAALGVKRGRIWGPGFAVGLSALSIIEFLPMALQPPFSIFLGVQVVLVSALVVRAVARERIAPASADRFRHVALAYASGLATPWLLVAAFGPTADPVTALLGLAGASVAAFGIYAALAGRTWGLFAMLGSIPFLLAIPSAHTCSGSAHDVAGELASFALAFAIAPWIRPVARFLRKG